MFVLFAAHHGEGDKVLCLSTWSALWISFVREELSKHAWIFCW